MQTYAAITIIATLRIYVLIIDKRYWYKPGIFFLFSYFQLNSVIMNRVGIPTDMYQNFVWSPIKRENLKIELWIIISNCVEWHRPQPNSTIWIKWNGLTCMVWICIQFWWVDTALLLLLLRTYKKYFKIFYQTLSDSDACECVQHMA